MLEILLVGKFSNRVAIVHDEFAWLKSFRWYGLKSKSDIIYACVSRHDDRRYVHRMVLDLEKGDERQVDHINHNGLDNRRENLRVVSHSENMMNQRKMEGSSKFKGVYWDKQNQKWGIKIRRDKKSIYFGLFDSEVEAAQVYDKKAKELFGEFAYLNF